LYDDKNKRQKNWQQEHDLTTLWGILINPLFLKSSLEKVKL